MPTPDILVARLKPYDPVRGHVRIDWKAPWGTKYVQGVWHEFDMNDAADTAAVAYLETVKQVPTADHDVGAFDICDEDEAVEIIVAERTGNLEEVAGAEEDSKPVPPKELKGKKADALNASPAKHELELRQARAAAGGSKTAPVKVDKAKTKARRARAGKATPRTRAQPKRKKKANTRKTDSGRRNRIE